MDLILFAISFVLVFLCSLVALQRIDGFSGCARWLVAACVALLSGFGLIAFVGDDPPPIGPDRLGLLLPYAALGGTLIVLLFLMAVVNIHRSFRDAVRRRRRLRDGGWGTPGEGPALNDRPSAGADGHEWRLP